MTDVHTPEQRSGNMSGIRGKDTAPELLVRSLIHGLGYRFRLHRKDLPGKPDLLFPSRRKVIFVHGCFWHMHDCRYGRVTPATRTEFWQNKRLETVECDLRAIASLKQSGWECAVVWECETRTISELGKRLSEFLENGPGECATGCMNR